MWVEHVGFFPITALYALTDLAFKSKVEPLLRIWSHPNDIVYHKAHLLLKQSNNTSKLPSNKVSLDRNLGVHDVKLKDEYGLVGHITYTITTPENPQRLQFSNLPMSLSGENLMLMHLEEEETKIVSTINDIYLNPQVFLAIPL